MGGDSFANITKCEKKQKKQKKKKWDELENPF